MAATTVMHIRIDQDTEAKAAQTLDALGLSIPDAVRIFLRRLITEEELALTLKVPSSRTKAAIAEAEAISDARFSTAGDLIRAIEKAADAPTGESSAEE